MEDQNVIDLKKCNTFLFWFKLVIGGVLFIWKVADLVLAMIN
jgi:hypothetical protein